MADPFVAEIRIFGFNFAPRGWAFCNGQLLPISQNTALFSLLGTTYGGDGKSTFALPDLQGATPMGSGQGPGLSDRFLGEQSGSQNVTLLQSEMPAHSHQLGAQNVPLGGVVSANGNTLNRAGGGGTPYGSANLTLANMAPQTLSITGGSQPHNNLQPYLTMNFCIAMQGIFPPRG